MANVPNTSVQGQVLTSAGDGTNTAYWGTGGTVTLGGDVTGPSTSNTVTKLQGHAVSASTPTTGNILEWSGTSWYPAATPTATGNLLQYNGSSWAPVGAPTTQGQLLMWNSSSNQWVAIAAPSTDGQILTWSASGQYWYANTYSPSGAVSNNITSVEANSVSITSSLSGVSTFTINMSGFQAYHVTFTATMQSTASGGQAQLNVYYGTGGVAVSPVGNTVGVYETTAGHDNMVVFQKAITGLTASTTYTFEGYAAITGSGTQQIVNGVLTIMGVY